MANRSHNTHRSVRSSNPELECQDILQSLRRGQYDRGESFFAHLRDSSDFSAYQGFRILASSALLLCQACEQLKNQADNYHSLSQDSQQREQGLRIELCELTSLLIDCIIFPHQSAKVNSDVNETNIRMISATADRHLPALTQLIQKLFGVNANSRPSEELTLIPSGLALPEVEVDAAPECMESTIDLPPPPSLLVFCLGRFQVYLDGQLVGNWPVSKGKLIFKYLVTHRDQPVAKEILMDLFWSDVPPESARRNLNWAIHNLRQILHRCQPDISHVLFQDECYCLNPDLQIWLDVDEFETYILKARSLEENQEINQAIHAYQAAESLYHGEFLEEDRYEDWVQPRRLSVQNNYLLVLEHLSRLHYDRQKYEECVNLCNKMLATDPCREEAHLRLMQCYLRQGYPYLAIRQYQLCVEKLKTELDVLPSSTTTALYAAIRSGKCESALI